MKIELNENKIFFNNGKSVQEIHPFWLRERVDGDEYLDKGTQQRLFDPSQMDGEIIIKKAQIKNGILEVDFNDGVNSKLDISKLETEFSNKDTVIKSIPKNITKYVAYFPHGGFLSIASSNARNSETLLNINSFI